ncbi:putative phage abortive infection protein [Neisseria cinerea]|uniref:putative phage abortive infection protein n=1 Tax=Neisseria cinerea TaxID=483 RepID=UPI0028896227|nr:putative phage abortive infection protein [Neisseria cinerea]
MNKTINRLWKITGFISIVILSIYFYQFHKFPLGNQEVFGQFGDYLGGILNPILTATNIFLLIYFNKILLSSTWKQHLDNEDKEQIFRLIENQHIILRNIRMKNKTGYDEGANAFWKMRGIIYEKYRNNMDTTNEIERLRKAYNEFYKDDGKRQYLGHYFRNLYHIFKFIENSSLENKKEYAQIVAAQMSYLEQHFLFLNCLIPEGEGFKKYVVDFDLLQELPAFEFDSKKPKLNIQIKDEINNWR